jgi:hypothetical protein
VSKLLFGTTRFAVAGVLGLPFRESIAKTMCVFLDIWLRIKKLLVNEMFRPDIIYNFCYTRKKSWPNHHADGWRG